MPDTRIDVAAGVLRRGDRVLLAERVRGGHGDGYWEFPGGKIEPGESPSEALTRELEEEIGVRIDTPEPLITLSHDYPQRQVRLHVFEVFAWQGQPAGREGQALQWCAVSALDSVQLLEANAPIVAALTR
ncbi:MAG: 8-oxo-dGTP diphosphatase MutT [Pseudomonadota bacterium]